MVPIVTGLDKFFHLLCNVAFKPKYGGYLVAAWLGGIIINLLLIPGFFDIAFRDFGLSLGALALARLGREFPS